MTDVQEVADRLAIAELAQRERRARDARDWDVMRASYHPEETRVFLSWFDGSAEDFIEGSRAMATEPGGHAMHSLGPTLVRRAGERALADTGCSILIRRTVGGVGCDITSYCRHYSRVERVDGVWRLRTLVGVYEKNTLAPVIPGEAPVIDTELLGRFRASYDYQSYFRALHGLPVFTDRPGLDREDLMARFLAAEDRWLAGESVPLGVGEGEGRA